MRAPPARSRRRSGTTRGFLRAVLARRAQPASRKELFTTQVRIRYRQAERLKAKQEGDKSNRSAIGARVLARYGGKTQAQAFLSQSSFYSCNDPRLHFGLGSSTSVDLDVYWPNGLHESFKQITANQLITLKEGVGAVPNRGWSEDVTPRLWEGRSLSL